MTWEGAIWFPFFNWEEAKSFIETAVVIVVIVVVVVVVVDVAAAVGGTRLVSKIFTDSTTDRRH